MILYCTSREHKLIWVCEDLNCDQNDCMDYHDGPFMPFCLSCKRQWNDLYLEGVPHASSK